VFVAGGIGTGEIIANTFAGAAGVQLGTRFVAAEECIAHPRFKEAFVRAAAATPCPPRSSTRRSPRSRCGDHQRGDEGLQPAPARPAEQGEGGELPREEAQVKLEEFWVGALRRAVVEGDVEHDRSWRARAWRS